MRVLLFAVMLLLPVPGALAQPVWVQANGVPATNIWSIVEHQGELFAAADTLLYRSADGGTSWSRLQGLPAITLGINALLSHREVLYAGTVQQGVFRSTDNGTTWQEFTAGLGALTITHFTVLGDSLYAGTDGAGVFVCDLIRPASWSAYNDGLPVFSVNSIAASGDNLVAGIGLDLFARPRGGSAWTEIELDTTIYQLTALSLHVLGSHLFAGSSSAIYRGSLDGSGWKKVGISLLPGLPIETLASEGARLFAGVNYHSDHFICSTDDAGGSWQVRAHEFANLLDLKVSGGRLWAGRTDGLWSADLRTWNGSEQPAARLPASVQLEQNFPNPFNPSTTIRFALPYRAQVKLTVHDLLGREVVCLFDGPGEAGSHQREFRGDHLASGVYFYTLLTRRLDRGIGPDTFISTRSLIIVR